MVKEVEFQNIAETVKVGDAYVPYTTDPALEMFDGFLTDDGKTLTVDVNREIPVGYARRVTLYYANVDLSNAKVGYVELGATPLLTNDPTVSYVGSSHKFDLSPVLVMPQRTASRTPIDDITIDLFTYEANVVDGQGNAIYQKRLSVPYKVVGDASTDFAPSTDGWYVLGTVDYKLQDIKEQSLVQYLKGDIIYWYEHEDPDAIDDRPRGVVHGDLWIANEDTYGPPTGWKGIWSRPTDEEILNFILLPRPASITRCATIVHTDILISRYVKQHYIANTLTKTSFKPHDDSTAWYASDLLSSMRELALYYLQMGDGAKAKYILDDIANEYTAAMLSKRDYKQISLNLNYTA